LNTLRAIVTGKFAICAFSLPIYTHIILTDLIGSTVRIIDATAII
jgi:hypothetical protein